MEWICSQTWRQDDVSEDWGKTTLVILFTGIGIRSGSISYRGGTMLSLTGKVGCVNERPCKFDLCIF